MVSCIGPLPGIDGIGYLIGRGTIAPGRLVLKGYERIVVERKLAAARTVFPHTDDEDIEGLEVAYDELLNLTRPDLYPISLRNKAMRLLMLQVIQHDISQLMKSLLKWPRQRIQVFLTSLVNYMTKEMIKGVTLSTKLKANTILAASKVLFLPDPYQNPAAPSLIHFITELTNAADASAQAVAESGVLELFGLWHLYEFNTFSNPTSSRRTGKLSSPTHPLMSLMDGEDDEDDPKNAPSTVCFTRRKECWRAFNSTDPVFRLRLGDIRLILEDLHNQISSSAPMSMLLAIGDLFDFVTADFVDASFSDEALQLMNEELTWYRAGSEKAVTLVTTFIDSGFDGAALVLACLVRRLQQWALDRRSRRALPGVSLFWSAVIRDSQTPFDMIF